MSGESISSLILFVAAMLVAAGVAGTLVVNVNAISGSVATHGSGVADTIDTDIEIISDPGSDAIYDDEDETVTILVKNTGSKTLDHDGGELDILVNGEYTPIDESSITLYGENIWRSGTVAELEGDAALDRGEEHRVVTVVNDSEATIEFYLPEDNA